MHVNWRRGEDPRRVRNDHGYRHGLALRPWKVKASRRYRFACRRVIRLEAREEGHEIVLPRWRRSILTEAL